MSEVEEVRQANCLGKPIVSNCLGKPIAISQMEGRREPSLQSSEGCLRDSDWLAFYLRDSDCPTQPRPAVLRGGVGSGSKKIKAQAGISEYLYRSEYPKTYTLTTHQYFLYAI